MKLLLKLEQFIITQQKGLIIFSFLVCFIPTFILTLHDLARYNVTSVFSAINSQLQAAELSH